MNTLKLTDSQIAEIEKVTGNASDRYKDAHNAAYLKGKGDTKGAVSDLAARSDDLIVHYCHLIGMRHDRTHYTAETFITAANLLAEDCSKRALGLGWNENTHADSFALLIKPRRPTTREERAEARANRR